MKSIKDALSCDTSDHSASHPSTSHSDSTSSTNPAVTPLPGFKLKPSPQLWFSEEYREVAIKTGGQARTIAGDFAEEITAVVTGAKRMVTDSKCLVCPDLRYDDNVFFESKSVGRTGSAIVYECRARKDKHFVEQYDKKLYYWFWFHRAAVVDARTVKELRGQIAASLYYGVVIDFDDLHAALLQRQTKVLNTAYIRTGPNSGSRLGYGSYDYGTGWSVPRTLLLELARHGRPLSLPRKVYGHDIADKSQGMPPLELRMPDFSYLRFVRM